jgi:hypothetical protein
VAPTDKPLDLASGRQSLQRAVQPAGVAAIDARLASLQHVLSLEVRARAIGAGDGRGDARLALQGQPVHRRQLGVQAERAVQLQHLIGLHGDGSAQAGIGGIADRRSDRQAVHAAAADHHHHLAFGQVALAGGEGLAAHEADRDAETGGEAQEGAAIGLSGHRR